MYSWTSYYKFVKFFVVNVNNIIKIVVIKKLNYVNISVFLSG